MVVLSKLMKPQLRGVLAGSKLLKNANRIASRRYAAAAEEDEEGGKTVSAMERKIEGFDATFVEQYLSSLDQESNPFLQDWKKLGKPSQAKFMEFLTLHMGKAPAPYKEKYPGVTLEDVDASIKAQIDRPFHGIDGKFYEFVNKLGYTKQEADEVIYCKYPEMFLPGGKIEWSVAQRIFSSNNADAKNWKIIADCYDNILKGTAARKADEAEVKGIDWARYEQIFGKEFVEDYKPQVESVIKQIPNFNDKEITTLIKSYFDPLVAEIKDEIQDSVPQIIELTDQIILAGELKRRIEENNGMHIDEFLDDFFPAIRDEIDMEIENDDYDYEYSEAFKKDLEGQTYREFILTKEEERDRIEALFEEGGKGEGALFSNPERERLMKEWQKEQENARKLESEVNTLKNLGQEEEDIVIEEEEEDDEKKIKVQQVETPEASVVKEKLIKEFDLPADYWEKLAAEEREQLRKEREAKMGKADKE